MTSPASSTSARSLLRDQVLARVPLRGQLGEQVAYTLATPTGRSRLTRITLEHLTWSVAISQLAIWIFDVDARQPLVATIAAALIFAPACLRVLPARQAVGDVGRPRRPARFRLQVGDLLATDTGADGIIVAGVSDRVDDGFPGRLSANTVVAQVVDKHQLSLGTLAELLWGDAVDDEPLPRLPIGKTLRVQGTNVMLLVFASLQDHGSSESTPVDLMTALTALWDRVRTDNIKHVHLPLLGSGYGGASLPRSALFSMLLSSFMFAHETSPVCESVTVHVLRSEYEPSDFEHADAILHSSAGSG